MKIRGPARICAVGILLLAAYGRADGPAPTPEASDRNRALAAAAIASITNAGAADAYWVRPGLVADRKARRVRLFAEATALRADDIVEFFLLTQNSGHDYEALAVSLATATDIHAALEAIGIPPGQPYDPDRLRFWPRGERVVMTFAPHPPIQGRIPVRAERLVLDTQAKSPLPETGFVFVGSRKAEDPEHPGVRISSADDQSPNSIASDYNERFTVLDVPRRAPQGSVYSTLRVSPEFQFQSNSLIEVVLEPEADYGPAKRRVVELTLDVTLKPDPPPGLAGLRFQLRRHGEPANEKSGGLNDMLAAVSALVDRGHDPFVTLQLGDAVPVAAIRDLCAVLEKIDSEQGMRIDAPSAGQLYYRAYLPDPSFRDRQSRVAQPWELSLSIDNGKVAGTLTHIKQEWQDGVAKPALKIMEFPVASPAEFKEGMEKLGPGIPVILVTVDPLLSHGQLMNWLEPVRAKVPTVHVFVKE